MREKLLSLSLDKVKILEDCIENHEAYFSACEEFCTASMPTTSERSEATGEFIKELGHQLVDYELIGIGQSIISLAEKLADVEFETSAKALDNDFD